jgi:hypothetical protein
MRKMGIKKNVRNNERAHVFITCGYARSAEKQMYRKERMARSRPSIFLTNGNPSTHSVNVTFLS